MMMSPGSFNKALDDIFSDEQMDKMFQIDQKDLKGYKFQGKKAKQ